MDVLPERARSVVYGTYRGLVPCAIQSLSLLLLCSCATLSAASFGVRMSEGARSRLPVW
ncbi:hypothetical protein BDV93DRAFT_520604 [Ceratobasidium sp. AG-I]|nr:hypothetical protein BDV93DRAFT_520604 [Ceratobasidium sp. AG-I]